MGSVGGYQSIPLCWQVGFLPLIVLALKGGIGGIVHPPMGSIYHKNIPLIYCTYSPCRTWGVKNATDPTLLEEPEKSIEQMDVGEAGNPVE